jgi:NADPH:quinone reductase-like Zn-dependent oxidoreductase
MKLLGAEKSSRERVLRGSRPRLQYRRNSMNYKRIVISEFGEPDVLKLREEEGPPEPQTGEVLVKVLATSAAFTDTMIRKGVYPDLKQKPPFTPGYDMLGIIDKMGEGVTGFKEGEKVAALTVTGAYSQFMCVSAGRLVRVPDGVDNCEAVSLILTYVTAYQMMFRFARIARGDIVLIHGAGGAVGSALVQLGKQAGVKMYATASESKHDLIKRLGAVPIDYKTEDFNGKIQMLTPDGVDAVFDGIGEAGFKKSFKALRPGGRLVAYGFYDFVIGEGRKLQLIGAFIKLKLWNILPNSKRTYFYSICDVYKKHPDFFREDLKNLFRMLKKREIRPVIGKRMRLSEASEAHRLVERAAVEGKIVLSINTE